MDLINTGTDPWILEHSACEILNRDILEQLNLRSTQDPNSKEYDSLSAKIRNRLKQYTVQVEELSKKLKSTGASNSITYEERERRQRQVEILQSNILKLQNEFSKRRGESTSAMSINKDRSSLFGYKNKTSVLADMGTAGWGEMDETSPNTDGSMSTRVTASSSKPVDQLRLDQQQMLREQDEGLDSLSKIITRQKEIATTINVEVDQQNELLDDISHDMSRIDGRVQRDTNMIRVIGRKDTTWGYWVIIILLLIVILGVAFA